LEKLQLLVPFSGSPILFTYFSQKQNHFLI
jgi:hypothetical protein